MFRRICGHPEVVACVIYSIPWSVSCVVILDISGCYSKINTTIKIKVTLRL